LGPIGCIKKLYEVDGTDKSYTFDFGQNGNATPSESGHAGQEFAPDP